MKYSFLFAVIAFWAGGMSLNSAASAQSCLGVVASRATLPEAQSYCRAWETDCAVIQSSNGWFAIVVGRFASADEFKLIIDRGQVPPDSFCSTRISGPDLYGNQDFPTQPRSTSPASLSCNSPSDVESAIAISNPQLRVVTLWNMLLSCPSNQKVLSNLYFDYGTDRGSFRDVPGSLRQIQQTMNRAWAPHRERLKRGGNIDPVLALNSGFYAESSLDENPSLGYLIMLYEYALYHPNSSQSVRNAAGQNLSRLQSNRGGGGNSGRFQPHCDPNDPNTPLRLDCIR